MSSNPYIKNAIRKFIKAHSVLFVDYSNWYIGVTSKPEQRHSGHGSPNIWRSWKAVNQDAARDIEQYFLKEGMQGDVGGGKNPRFVYVYKKSGPQV